MVPTNPHLEDLFLLAFLQITLDNADQILRITGYGQLPPADHGYLFGSLPGIIKWPLRIIVGTICIARKSPARCFHRAGYR